MIINAHRNEFDYLVAALLKKETLDGSEVQEIVDGGFLVDLDEELAIL